jgi:hypothetical protein
MPEHPTLRTSLRAIAALAVTASLLSISACAIPTSPQPDAVALDPDFAELLEPAPTTLATTPTTLEQQRNVSLYFVVDDLLALANTPMSISRAEQLTAVLNELVAGTRLENHRNAIPSGVEVAATSIDPGRRVATITLADNTLFTAVEGTERLRALAQFVFTATAPGNRFGVDAVLFEIDGNVRSVPTFGGSDKTEPVGRCDYERSWSDPIAGCPNSTTTTTSTAPPNGPADPLGDVP